MLELTCVPVHNDKEPGGYQKQVCYQNVHIMTVIVNTGGVLCGA